MGSFIAQQPNGLYCRFSTIVDTVTHYNMTKDDYIEVCEDRLGKKRGKEEANDILKNTINDTGLDLTNFDQQYNSLSSRKINIGSYVRKATYNFILYSLEGKDFTWNVAFKDQ